MRSLVALESPPLAAMRIVVGFLFACHGAQKLFGAFGGIDERGTAAPLASMMGIAGVVELAAGALVAVGFLSRYAAFIASGQMAVAYFMVHQPQRFLPIANGGELAALYAFVFLYLAGRGPGPATLGGGPRSGRPRVEGMP